jgi:alkylation response protein AidB-like acyl-CoA dehydrogenase
MATRAKGAGGATAKPTAAEMVARARKLAPKLAERAEECEKNRSVPERTVADFLDAELNRMLQPARYGGFEMGWDTLVEAGIELGKGCASQAWVLSVYGDHIQLVSTFARETQDEVWGDKPDNLISTCFAPLGKLTPSKGGYVASGRWSFSSGIDHASWVLAGAMVMGDSKGGPPKPAFFVVPKSAVKVIDDWHVSGLAGTGSKSFTMDEVFVAPHRVLFDEDAINGRGPGTKVNLAPVYRMPRLSAASALAAAPIGAAMGMLDDFCTLLQDKARRARRGSTEPMMALRVAEAAAELDCAKWLCVDSSRTTMEILARGEEVGMEQRMINSRNSSFAAVLTRHAADRVYVASGGSSIYTSSRLQRAMRDVLAGTQHIGLSWEIGGSPYGLMRLGHTIELSAHP